MKTTKWQEFFFVIFRLLTRIFTSLDFWQEFFTSFFLLLTIWREFFGNSKLSKLEKLITVKPQPFSEFSKEHWAIWREFLNLRQFFVKSMLSTFKNAKQQYFQNFLLWWFCKNSWISRQNTLLMQWYQTNMLLFNGKNCHSGFFEVLHTEIITNTAFWRKKYLSGFHEFCPSVWVWSEHEKWTNKISSQKYSRQIAPYNDVEATVNGGSAPLTRNSKKN